MELIAECVTKDAKLPSSESKNLLGGAVMSPVAMETGKLGAPDAWLAP